MGYEFGVKTGVGVQIQSAAFSVQDFSAEKQKTAKLVDGAHAFEAMMLEQMLKPLKFGEAPGTVEGESSDAGGDTTRGLGTEALAKAIASGGGFGIARQVIRQVAAEEAAKKVTKGD